MAEKINVRGVYFDNLTKAEVIELLLKRIRNGEKTAVYTPNPEIVQSCINDNSLYEVINSAEIVTPDGIGIVKAARILGTPLKEKVAGIEVGEAVIKDIAEKGDRTLFLMGGKPGVAEQARDALISKYPGLRIAGVNDGYFKKEGAENDAVIEKINASHADIILVCLGAPTQEKWIYSNRDRICCTAMLGLGGSIDVYAGNVKRAPKIFIKLGLEWFYRLLCEPWRLKRMMVLPKFYFETKRYAKKLKKSGEKA